MELKYLYTFKTILEADNFQKAAEHLNCAQSTVTFQIRQLEEELSVKLFEKIGRRMVLTQAGKEIIPCIEQVLQSVEQLKNYGRAETELTGPLKVAMPETLLMYRMQPVLRTFREQAPNVELSIQALTATTSETGSSAANLTSASTTTSGASAVRLSSNASRIIPSR